MSLGIKLWHVLVAQLIFLASLVWAADITISGMTELTDGNVAADDLVPCVDTSASANRKCQIKSIETAVHAAGSATAGSWPVFGSGTLLTTAEDGALEQDADNFYMTTDAGNRGIVPITQYVRAASAQTLTSQTGAQNIFDSPANGRLTLETGAYEFQGVIIISGMSGTSGNGQILFACGGTCGGWVWRVAGLDNSTVTTISSDLNAFFTTNASAASVVTANTGTALRLFIHGSFEMTVAGTWTPQIALVTAAAATVNEGSFLRISRMGAVATGSVGQWD